MMGFPVSPFTGDGTGIAKIKCENLKGNSECVDGKKKRENERENWVWDELGQA